MKGSSAPEMNPSCTMKADDGSNEACADIMYQLLGSTIVCTLDDGRVAVGRFECLDRL